jgi:hypothetical protein
MKIGKWSKEPVIKDNKISVVFTWQLEKAVQTAIENDYKIGGPAVRILPHLVPSEIRCLEDDGNWIPLHNPEATRTTIGCGRNCEFCLVKKIAPEFKEFPNFIPKSTLCDDNFLAASKRHIINSIDRLSKLKNIDFNQGLDARLFKSWHIDQFKRLHWHSIRLAWDSAKQENYVVDTINKLIAAGFPHRKISCYGLINFKETFDEAMYRFNTIKSLGVFPWPMRYQPGDSLTKNSYCSPNWSPILLARFIKYWSKQQYLWKVTFEEFLGFYYKSKTRLPPHLKV